MSKILLLHHSVELGGAGMSLYSIINMLSGRHEIKIFIPNKDSDLANFLKSKDITIDDKLGEIGMISAYSGGPNTFSRTFINKLLQTRKTRRILVDIIKSEKPDIIAVNSMTTAWVGKLIKKNKVKSICFVRETLTNSLWSKIIKYYLNNFFDGVIFISNFDKKKFSCKAQTTGVVRDCIDINEYSTNLDRNQACKKIGIEPSFFNILFVGGTSILKGWRVILSAMEMLKEYNIKLIVAGNSNIDEFTISQNIEFLGIRSDMNILYRACDVLVFPSVFPHQARPVFEAGFMGLPVIISDFIETKEFVSDMDNGLTFKPMDSRDLADKIVKLYNNKNLCIKLGKQNHEKSKKLHSFESNKEILLKTIFEIYQ